MKKGSKHTLEARRKLSESHKGQLPWNKGTKGLIKPNSGSFTKDTKAFQDRRHSAESKEKNRLAHIGKLLGALNPTWKGGKITKNCEICQGSFLVYPCRKEAPTCSSKCMGILQSRNRRGGKAANWRGGVTPIHQSIRTSPEYKKWRITVWRRDNFTCQACGERGGTLHAHHDLPFANYPSLRFEVLNGVTLCKECHIKTPTFAGRTKREEFSLI